MNVPVDRRPPPSATRRMRIAGKQRRHRRRASRCAIPTTAPWSAPCRAARPEHVREAFADRRRPIKPKLTRYERQQILLQDRRAARARARKSSPRLITAESGLCLKDSLYEVGRAYDVYSFAGQLAINDDGQIFSCDLTPHGKARKIFTHARSRCSASISAITPFNHPLNMVAHKLAPAIATNNRMVLKPTELTPLTALALADMLYEAGLPPEMLSVVTGNPGDIGDAMITDPRCRPHHLHRLGARSASTSPRRPATSASCWSSAATIR